MAPLRRQPVGYLTPALTRPSNCSRQCVAGGRSTAAGGSSCGLLEGRLMVVRAEDLTLNIAVHAARAFRNKKNIELSSSLIQKQLSTFPLKFRLILRGLSLFLPILQLRGFLISSLELPLFSFLRKFLRRRATVRQHNHVQTW